MRALALAEANAIIEATFHKANGLDTRPLAIVVLDIGGRIKSAQRQDGCAMLRVEIAQGKANAALAMGRSSRMVLQKAKDKPLFMESLREVSNAPLFLEGGGQLIRDTQGEVIGAVGVTGDTNEIDDKCVIAGIHAVGLLTDEDFEEQGGSRNVKLSY